MELNLNSEDRHALLSAARNGRGFVYLPHPTSHSQLLAKGLINRAGNYRALLTEQGEKARDFLQAKQDDDRLIHDYAEKAVREVLDPGCSNSQGPMYFSYTADGVTHAVHPFTVYLQDGTSQSGRLLIRSENGQITHEVAKDPLCSYDSTWEEGGVMDTETYEGRRIIVDHTVYYIKPDVTGPSGMKGFGGRRWDIVFLDGETMRTTHNLWQGRTVPPKWRERWPDTARFDWAYVEESRHRLGLKPTEF